MKKRKGLSMNSTFKLYDHQEEAAKAMIHKLKEYGICYLASEERFGKTLTAFHALEECGAKNVIVVTMKKAMQSIREDYELGGFDFDLEVINYESLVKIGDRKRFDAVVFDESTKISGFPKINIVTREAAKLISESKPDFIVWLNATPAIESYAQMFYQFRVSGKVWTDYPNFYKWHKDYGVPKTSYIPGGRSIQVYDEVKADKVWNDVKDYFVFGTREQAGFDFHTAQIVEHKFPVSAEVCKYYEEMEKTNVIKDLDVEASTITSKMIKLHQLTSGFVYNEAGDTVVIDDSKVRFLKDKVVKGEKVAIYYAFNAERDMLRKAFPRWTDDPYVFRDSDVPVLLLQIQSGSKGIDLHFADQHVFYSFTFSGETFVQALSRQFNKKRKAPVVVDVLVTHKMIDRYVLSTVKDKKDYNAALYRRGMR